MNHRDENIFKVFDFETTLFDKGHINMNKVRLFLILLFSIGCVYPAFSQSDNISFGKVATQSSDYSDTDGLAGNAVDGNVSGNWLDHSVTHTKREGSNNPWWEIDLGKVYDIDRIEIWNRTDCCKERLDYLGIRVKNDPREHGEWFVNYLYRYQPDETYPLVFNGQKRGRYVYLELLDPNGILSLAEVKVYGKEAPINTAPGLVANKSAKWQIRNIPVCWETDGWDKEKKWVEEVIAGSWESFAKIEFTGWGKCGSADIQIQIADERDAPPYCQSW